MSVQYRLGVIGNPISHSLSPKIHQQFASQTGISVEYKKYLVEEQKLESFVRRYFLQGGQGLNVTLPFKQAVADFVDEVSDEAEAAGSINTLYQLDGRLIGTTSDGQGLLLDLDRLRFDYQNKKVLVVGAGGASQSIILSLLKSGAKVSVLNRTESKVTDLIKRFSGLGEINSFVETHPVDAIISTTSQFNAELSGSFQHLVATAEYCYDLNYGSRAAEFLNWCNNNGADKIADGFGMLVGQAAQSFKIWTGQLPEIDAIDKQIIAAD